MSAGSHVRVEILEGLQGLGTCFSGPAWGRAGAPVNPL